MSRKIFSFVLLILLPVFSLSFLSGQILAADNNTSDDASDQLIIKYKKGVPSSQKQFVKNLYLLENKGKVGKDDSEVVKIKSGKVKDMLEKIGRDSRVEFVEQDYKAKATEMTNDPGLTQSLQWGLLKIQAAGSGISAWDYTHGNSSVAVAILDTGIDQDHGDLSGKISRNNNCTTSSTVDDLYGHGTHVAGIVGAVTNNGMGMAGVGYTVSLINAKVLDDSGSGYYSWIANCLYWAADNGADVINLSLSGSATNTTLQNAVSYAISKGVVVVAAAGNSGNSTPVYPAYYPNVISVAATDSDDNRASFSNYGKWVDVAAPGVSIYSTMPNHRNSIGILNYGYLSGTSMATPYVSGLAGLLMSINPNNLQVKKSIEDGADHIAGTGYYWLSGRINALNSIILLSGKVIGTPTPFPLPVVTETSVPVATSTPTPNILPTATDTPTTSPVVPTSTPTPTIILTQTPTPTPRSFLCRYNKKFCK